MPVKFDKFLVISGSVGVLVPIAIVLSTKAFGTSDSALLELILFAIWPSTIFLMAAPSGGLFTEAGFFSILANCLLYGLVGGLLWLGVYRSKFYFLSAGAVLATVAIFSVIIMR